MLLIVVAIAAGALGLVFTSGYLLGRCKSAGANAATESADRRQR